MNQLNILHTIVLVFAIFCFCLTTLSIVAIVFGNSDIAKNTVTAMSNLTGQIVDSLVKTGKAVVSPKKAQQDKNDNQNIHDAECG